MSAKYRVYIDTVAWRQIMKLPEATQHQIFEAIESLESNPRPVGSTKLKGSADYRLRSGNYRILYSIFDDRLVVLIVRVGNRRDVYRQRD